MFVFFLSTHWARLPTTYFFFILVNTGLGESFIGWTYLVSHSIHGSDSLCCIADICLHGGVSFPQGVHNSQVSAIPKVQNATRRVSSLINIEYDHLQQIAPSCLRLSTMRVQNDSKEYFFTNTNILGGHWNIDPPAQLCAINMVSQRWEIYCLCVSLNKCNLLRSDLPWYTE